ncbi:MAG TPA: sigma 54-interacting transcriptional regulator, partial [Myxococcaceae bacterium]
IGDPSVSRQHAEVLLTDGEARIVDLGSHNGVRVNGEAVTGSQVLQGGDVVMLGDVALVFHAGARPQPVWPILGPLDLRARLSEELERVANYERAVSVLALEPGAGSAPLAELARAASGGLRMIDLLGQTGTSLVVVLPEMGAEEARAAGEHLLELLLPLAPQARAGTSSAPEDGLSTEALLVSARAAATAAPPRELVASGPASRQIAFGDRSVVVADPAMVKLYELLRRLAASSIPILIHGETGSGKENAAWALHHCSPRSSGPFVPLNCAAIPESLAESELFGHERGAFSGADKARVGRIEQSSGGTLFLDEVGELPLPIQAKLLRALDQKRVTRLGDSKEREVDLRVVAATHRTLAEEVKAGRFREDLFYRLSAAVVVLPPLRDRPCELPLLVNAFLAEACARQGRPPLQLSAAAIKALSAHSWPGNVRELKNAMEYVAAVTPGPVVEPSHLPFQQADPPEDGQGAARESDRLSSGAPAGFRPIAEELREIERRRMCEALSASAGVHTRAAKLIGMPLRTFTFKLKRYRISERDWEAAK